MAVEDYTIYIAAAIALVGFWIALKIIRKLIMAAVIAGILLLALLYAADMF